jgi:hypothetical protein
MCSSEAMRRGLSVHNVLFSSPRAAPLLVTASVVDLSGLEWRAGAWVRTTDPMEGHFRRAACAEIRRMFFAPGADYEAFCRRIRRNGPSLKKKHARYRRIWLAALALRVKE